jgi:uncharacterized SAM-dependent methyltransferase
MSRALVAAAPESATRSPAVQEFAEDMVDFFGEWRGGHIARHGYVGKGGSFYERWLATNGFYRSQVTLAETEIITTYVAALAEICGNTNHFVEAGVGSFKAFLMKTHALLARLAAREPELRYTIADVSRLSYEDVAGQTAKLRLPKPDFHEGNFFQSLPPLEKGSVVYIPGLTFTNIPEDAIKGDTAQILTTNLAFFAKSLQKGGVLIFSYATADGIDDKGTQVKAFYDDPLIHKYQESIFHRVRNELPVEGNYDPNAFGIRHIWRPEKAVLTRHAVLHRPLDFTLEGQEFALRPETFGGYMANNFRPSDRMMKQAALAAGFKKSRVFSLPHSNVRVMACVMGG